MIYNVSIYDQLQKLAQWQATFQKRAIAFAKVPVGTLIIDKHLMVYRKSAETVDEYRVVYDKNGGVSFMLDSDLVLPTTMKDLLREYGYVWLTEEVQA